MSDQQKKNTFYGATVILTMSTVLVEIIGAILKISLTAILPEEAYDDFDGVHNTYFFFLAISTAGLSVTLSKAASKCHTLGRENQKHRVLRVTSCAFLFMGLFSFLCMSVFGQLVATYIIDNERAMFYVWALAPAVLCTCCYSTFRSYTQGHMNMMLTAIPQIIETLCELLLSLGPAMVVMSLTLWSEDIRNQLAASSTFIGVSFGSVLSVIYLTFNHLRTYRSNAVQAADQLDRSRVVLARLLKLAIPIALSSCFMFLVTAIDTNLVDNRLQNVFTAVQGGMAGISNSSLDISPRVVEIFQNSTDTWQQVLLTDPTAKLDPILDSARNLYGICSKTMSVYNLSFDPMIPLTTCIVPGISACLVRSDRLGARWITESVMRVAALIALPCGFGLLALDGPIMELIALGNADIAIAGPILSTLGIASISVCFRLVGAAVPQVNDIVDLPIIMVIIGGVIKILVNYTLVDSPKIMIFGAPMGTLSCLAVTFVLNLLIIKRCVSNPPRYLAALSKLLATSAIMAVATQGSHGLLARVLNGSLTRDMTATAGAVLADVAVYVALVLVLHTLTWEDPEAMPGGKRLAKILHIQ